jgi:hypothetical protein
MPLPLPNLDDRRWTDLVEEGRALIPRYAPRWTDHNISDPGITLVELLAWMAESSVYALNRITPRHRYKFLSLLGFAPVGPQPSQTMLTLVPPGAIAPFELPSGLELLATPAGGAALTFRTLRSITVSNVRLTTVQIDEGGGLENRTTEWRNGLPIRVFGGSPRPGAAIYFGFTAIPAKTPITFALRWDRPGPDAAARAMQSRDERLRLIAERVAAALACRKPLPQIACPGATPESPAPATLPPHHSARVVWEAFTGTWTPLRPIDPPGTPAEGEIADDTRSLTLDGLVEVNLPAAITMAPQGVEPTALFYIRCRLASGAYDAPPALLDVVSNAVPAEQSVPLWHRFTIPAGVTPAGTSATVPKPGANTRFRLTLEPSGVIKTLVFDPIAAGLPDVFAIDYEKVAGTAGRLTVALAYAGRGERVPNQPFVLSKQAIAATSDVRVFSHAGTTWQRWDIRPSFDASRRTDFHATLEQSRALLQFGDGERSRVVPRGDSVLVSAHVTAGAAGVLPAGATVRIAESPMNQLLLKGFPVPVNVLASMTRVAWPAYGGADQETLSHAAGRAAELLHAQERLVDLATAKRVSTLDDIEADDVRALPAPTNAVNLLDLERIALDVPGTRVARARAWPGVHPQFSCLSAPGWITLVIIPDMPVDMPQPSVGLLRALKRYLNRRRMVATVLKVVGPTYLPVNVSAVVRLRRGAGSATGIKQIKHGLNVFLHPLKGGPDRHGWPFGRPVYRAEILQLIDGVPGVDHVLDLSLAAAGGVPVCGNITLCPTWLAVAGTLDIRIA